MKNYLRVDLYDWDRPEQNEPDIKVWFIFKEGDKEVKIYSIEENKHYLKSIPVEGICGRLMKRYYLKDGLKFLEELKYAFHGSRIRASEVYEVTDKLKLEEPEPKESEEEEDYENFGEDEFLNGAANILKNKLCFSCIHINADNQTCKAFPDGIPIVYLTGQKEHTKPSKKYHQKNNIVWEYDKDQVWIKRQWEEEAKFETKVIKCGVNQDKANRICKKLEKEGWDVDVRNYDEWPQEFTIYASRKKKK